MIWRRLFVLGSAVWIAACSGGWSADEKAQFMNDCLTNVRLEDPQLRKVICTCWLDRISEQYSLSEINSGNQTAQAAFVAIGKACSAEQGVRASLPGDVDLGHTPKDAPKPPTEDAPEAGK